MRTLIAERDYRIIVILTLLMNDEWLSLTSLSNSLNVSEKTIRNDIGVINSAFEGVHIESSFQFGYHLIKNESFPIENTIEQIIDNTLIIRLLLILLKDKTLKLTELESLLFISSNSIRSTIRNFNKKMASENLQIKNRPFRVEGDEIKITSIYFIRLHQSYFNRTPSEKEKFDFLNELIPLLFENNAELKQKYAHNQYVLTILLYIRIYREKNGYSIEAKPTTSPILYTVLNNKTITINFYNLFRIPLTEHLINCVVDYTLYQNTATNYLQVIYQFDHTIEYQFINHTINNALENIKKSLGLSSSSSTDVTKIIQAPFVDKNITPIDYRVHFILLELLKYESKDVLNSIENQNQKYFFDNYIFVEFVYLFQLNNAAHPLLNFLKPLTIKINVAVLLIEEYNHIVLFKEFLQFNFGHIMTFEFINNFRHISDFDLLVTNSFDYARHNIENDIPIINLAGLPTDRLYKIVQKHYQKYILRKYQTYKDR